MRLNSTPFVSFTVITTMGIIISVKQAKIIKVKPSGRTSNTKMFINELVVPPKACARLLTPIPVPLLSVGSNSSVINLIIPHNPQNATCVRE